MEQRGDMRASDTDRQSVADQLRRALDEGRLDLHEYDERLQRAYAAKTYGELSSLLTDLPGTVGPGRSRVAPASPPAAPAQNPPRRTSPAFRHGLAAAWGSYFRVVAITTAIWLVTGIASDGLGYFWPIWVAGPWGAVLLVSTVTGRIGGAPRHWHGSSDRWHCQPGRYAARGHAGRGC